MPFPPYPSSFYYEEKGNEDDYSFTPQGELDVGRFIRNEAPWKKPGAIEKHKKFLVLYDWSKPRIGFVAARKELAAVVSSLQKDGFDVGLYLHSEVHAFKKDEDVLTQINQMNPLSKISETFRLDSEVREAVKSKYKLPDNQICVVNDYWQKIIKSSNEFSAEILPTPVIQLNHSLSAEEREKLLRLYNERAYQKIEIICREYTENQTLTLKECKDKIKNLTIKMEINQVNLTENQLETLISSGTVSLNSINLTTNDLANLGALVIIGEIKNIEKVKANISRIFEFAPKIDSILTGSKDAFIQIKEFLNDKPDVGVVHDEDETRAVDQAIQDISISNPEHDPDSHFSIKPKNEDFTFHFEGKNNTLNQNMIMEKLSQYFILKNKHLELIPKINDGMCHALSRIFNKKSVEEWNTFIATIANWDGSIENINESLKSHFKEIYSEFKDIYVHGNTSNLVYLGENLSEFLNAKSGTYILGNPWHAISVKYSEEQHAWLIYDPNYVDGFKAAASIQAAVGLIENALGKHLMVESDDVSLKPGLGKADHFLQTGGLLALYRSSNANHVLDVLPPEHQYSDDGLKGILMRFTDANPGWALGLYSTNPRVQSYTCELITQYYLKHRDTFAEDMAKSMADIPEFAKFARIEALISASATHPDNQYLKVISESVRDVVHKNILTSRFNKQLETWNKNALQPQSTLQYCQDIVNGEKKKRLIELTSTQTVQALSLALQQHCASIHRPYFYIDSPEDLICSAAYVKRDGGNGVLTRGPGGRLHDFLLAHQDKDNPPVLIVNYDNFTADDIVKFNALLDKIRRADGTLLPESAVVVGLINPEKPNCYQGEDFYSRFGKGCVDHCHLTVEQLMPELPSIPVRPRSENDETYPINLCHAKNWKERLLGQWVIKKDKLYFEEGLLVAALESGKPIEIQNGLWHDPSFKYFWDQACVLGYFPAIGNHLSIGDTSFIRNDGYDWKKMLAQVSWNAGLQPDLPVLNPMHFGDFFKRYQCDNDNKQLDTITGLIQAHAKQTLSVNLTRSLTEDQWASLLLECQKYGVLLQCHCPPSIALPEIFNVNLSSAAPSVEEQKPSRITVYQTNDVDVIVEYLLHGEEKWKVIDISECTVNDLLMSLNAHFNKDTLRFEFTESARVLIKAIENNENVILKGRFTPELADSLAAFLLDKKTNTSKSKISLVSHDTSSLSYLPGYNNHYPVKADDKQYYLTNHFGFTEPQSPEVLERETLSQSIARLRYQSIQSDRNPWAGLYQLPGGIQLEAFNKDNSEILAATFLQQRVDAVNSILATSPYVYLAGLTGVGKSTFVEKQLASESSVLYQGETAMQAWAEDKSDKRKILFIDEANITSREWSEFEGLFNCPPSIVIGGVYYELTDNHKVVFAGNPLNYGGGRKLAPLFERHGNALVFDPMPPEFIYEAILKPVFKGTPLEHQALDIADEILKVYKFLCECSRDEVLISPRELQMMALMVLSNADKKNVDTIALARYYAYSVASSLTPEKNRVEFQQLFLTKIPQATLLEKQLPEYLITPSREPLYQQLSDFVALREYRRSPDATNNEQRYGGLGGMVIEGEPGIGKSELVVAHLVAHGYKEVSLEAEAIPDKAFYKMPVSMQFDEKMKLLMKAFNEGAVVIIDEINSSPMMERLLNDLLMGKSPEGKRPDRPGFMIIGTQNPVTMSGRRKPSAALARRLMTTCLPSYPPDEMKDILIARGVEANIAGILVASFMMKSSQAKVDNLAPAPTFRDVLNTADDYLAGKLRSPEFMPNMDQAKVTQSQMIQAPVKVDHAKYSVYSEYKSQGLFKHLEPVKTSEDKKSQKVVNEDKPTRHSTH